MLVKLNNIVTVIKLVQVICNYAHETRAHYCFGI
jgi:hypothetical protein